MATKNMARTVIEGGRTTRSKLERYKSSRQQRARNRNFCKLTLGFVDLDDNGFAPKRDPVYKEFADKLGPMYRWLNKQVGKKWDRVFQELSRKFDTRTIAGNHVVKDHLLNSITLSITDKEHFLERFRFRNRYYIDESGILNCNPREPKGRSLYSRHKFKNICVWANNRLVMDYGVSIFWMVPERVEWAECGYSTGTNMWGRLHWGGLCERTHRIVPHLMKVRKTNGEWCWYKTERRECKQGKGVFRQKGRLSVEDIEIWNSLSIPVKRVLLHPGSVGRTL